MSTALITNTFNPDTKPVLAHQLVNAWEFAKLVKQSAETGRYVIAVTCIHFQEVAILSYALQAGDFNSIPSTLPMTVVLEHAGLDDVSVSLHPPPELSQVGGCHVNPADAISLYGFTYDSPLDSYSASERLETPSPTPQGKRIDYVLFCNPSHLPSTFSAPSLAAPPQLVPTDVRVMLTDHVSGHTFSYSDHFGVEATFRIEHPELKKDLLLPDVPADGKPQTFLVLIIDGTVSTKQDNPTIQHPSLTHPHFLLPYRYAQCCRAV